MQINKITLKNIRSYNEQELEFPKGSTLLSGDIGTGKTSILLAIEFALFGLQPGQRGNSLLRNSKKNGKVEIELQIDNQKIIIERTLKRAKTITQDYCAITINGEKKETSVMELKDKILNLLNYPKEFAKKQNILYKFTVYTPQEEMKQIILQDAATRINTLRHIFGINKYKKIIENTSIILSNLREEKRIKQAITQNLEHEKININIKEKKIQEIKKRLTFLQHELLIKTNQRKQIQKEKEKLSEKINERNKLIQEIEKTKLMTSEKRDNLLSDKKTIEQLTTQINELLTLKTKTKETDELKEKAESLKNKKEKLFKTKIDITTQINSLQIQNEEKEKLRKKISNLEICPTCLQNVEAHYRTNILNKINSDISKNQKEIQERDHERTQINKNIKIIESEINLKEKEINELNIIKIKLQYIQEKQTQIESIKEKQETLQKDINLLEEHTKILINSIKNLSEFEIPYNIKQKELEENLRQERILDIKRAELKKEIEVSSKNIEELKQRTKEIEKIKNELNYIINLENWLSKKFLPLITLIEQNTMTKLKTEFSKLFSKWFSILVSDSFYAKIDDNFTPIIEQQDYEINYAYLSGGERTAIALAYRLALNQIINSLQNKIKTKDLVILDEPTDGFSSQQLDRIRDILQELKIKQLIIVSHEQKIESFVENIIKLKKENGISFKHNL